MRAITRHTNCRLVAVDNLFESLCTHYDKVRNGDTSLIRVDAFQPEAGRLFRLIAAKYVGGTGLIDAGSALALLGEALLADESPDIAVIDDKTLCPG